jgi:hypothetical protein
MKNKRTRQNPVAKNAFKFNKCVAFKSKVCYNRHSKHKGRKE